MAPYSRRGGCLVNMKQNGGHPGHKVRWWITRGFCQLFPRQRVCCKTRCWRWW